MTTVTFRDEIGEIFGRKHRGGIALYYCGSGEVVTRLARHLTGGAPVWPISSPVGAAYEHPHGLILTPRDAKRLGIVIEAGR